jgi:hypothetical protein
MNPNLRRRPPPYLGCQLSANKAHARGRPLTVRVGFLAHAGQQVGLPIRGQPSKFVRRPQISVGQGHTTCPNRVCWGPAPSSHHLPDMSRILLCLHFSGDRHNLIPDRSRQAVPLCDDFAECHAVPTPFRQPLGAVSTSVIYIKTCVKLTTGAIPASHLGLTLRSELFESHGTGRDSLLIPCKPRKIWKAVAGWKALLVPLTPCRLGTCYLPPFRTPLTLNQRLLKYHRKFKCSIAFTASSSDEKSASSYVWSVRRTSPCRMNSWRMRVGTPATPSIVPADFRRE